MTNSGSFGVNLSKSTIIFEIFGLQFFSPAYESFGDGCKKHKHISRKHKFILAMNFVALSFHVCGVILAIELEKQTQKNGNVKTGLTVQIFSYSYTACVIFISIVNAFFSTRICYKIFNNFKKISSIFHQDLNRPLDYSKISAGFNLLFTKITLVFIASTVATMIFVFCFNQSNIFFWACLCIYPYFSCQIIFCQFIFYTRLVKENLLGLKAILESLLEQQNMSKIPIHIIGHKIPSSNASRETIDTIIDLKKIYGMLYETTALIHASIGVGTTATVVMIVLSNISAGYKVYLSFKGDIVLERVAGNNFVRKYC